MNTLLLLAASLTAGADPAADEFFEKSVRPVLVEHCVRCHGEKKQKGGVRLDAAEHVFKELDGDAPVVKPKDVKGSRLLKSVRHEGDYAMPPDGKLKAEEIAALEKWVETGAAWPTKAKAADSGKPHWAFVSVAKAAVPAGEDREPVDRFLAAKLKEKGMTFSPPADKAVWLRRVTLDLTGLPPTPKERDDFLADTTAGANEKVVDRLLASPAFGERWGRHWLDVARYADTREAGFQVDVRYPFAWTYRDWVIRAFNADVGYDQFVRLQLAADHIRPEKDSPDLAALAFLAVGRRFGAGANGNPHDIIDDRIDALSRGLLGLSVSCARCHDHKFDPIPTKDYYSLYGTFAQLTQEDRPFAATDDDRKKLTAFNAEMTRRRQAWDDYSLTQHDVLFGDAFSAAGYAASLIEWADNRGKDVGVPKGAMQKNLAERRRSYLDSHAKQKWHSGFGPFFAFAKLPAGEFEATAGEVLKSLPADDPYTLPLVRELFHEQPPPKSLAEVAGRYGKLFERIDKAWRAKLAGPRKDGTPFVKLDDAKDQELLNLLIGRDGLGYIPTDEMHYVLNGEPREGWLKLKNRLADLKTEPTAPPHAMAVTDPGYHVTPKVFVRGKPESKGAEVPQQFLAIATAGERKPFASMKGRLGLADAVADPKNPLTARVWVNRVWAHLFGQGIVKTPSDFGVRGEPPTHPELLDWMAGEFVANGWSNKKLLRRLVLSRAYEQASAERADCFAKDPANELLWRMPRRRLDFEAYRDSALAVAGGLDAKAGGPAVDVSADPTSRRRTVYLKVDRVTLSALHKAFDFANPDLHTPQRFETTVPQQSVLLLNHPFAADIARQLADRIDKQAGTADPEKWARTAYRTALGREPSDKELTATVAFLSSGRTPKAPANRPVYWEYGLAKWDAKKQELSGFEPLKEFTEDSWQDPKKAGTAKLTVSGGRTTTDASVAVVRRWVAPAAGKVKLDGSFHPKDGKATAMVVSTRRGVVGTWGGREKPTATDVKELAVAAGEALDFFVQPSGSADTEFDWKFTVQAVDSPLMGKMVWNSAGHFDGPPPAPSAPLTLKQQLAQVLLMTNEFAFID